MFRFSHANLFGRFLVAAALVVGALVSSGSAESFLRLQVDRDRIYLGESFMLYAKVSGDDAAKAELDLSQLRDAEIQRFAPQSSRSMSIVNGKVTKDVSITYPIAIKPTKDGEYRAGPVRLTDNGKTTTATAATVTVVGIEEQDYVRIAVVPSGDTLLVDEPFTVTFTVSIAEIPDHASLEPIHREIPPHIDAGFLEIEDVDGLKVPDISAILNRLVSRNRNEPVFEINDYKSREMGFGFGMFDMDDPFRARPIPFRIPPKHVETPDGSRWEYSIALDYVAKKEGDYTFGPVTFKGKVITGVERHDGGASAVPTDVFAIGPAATVRVVPPPEEGRPDWFVGSVGRAMNAHAELDTPICKVGDPLTLDLRVTGDISLDNLRPPILSLQPEITADFRVYEDDVNNTQIEGGRSFKYRVRPLKEGTLEFPPIKLAYYDTAKKAYETVMTDPIPVQAHATTQIASETVDSGDGDDGENGAPLSDAASAARSIGITMTPKGFSTQSLLPPLRPLVAALLIPPFASLAAWLLSFLWKSRDRIRTRFERSGARSCAIREIKAACRECMQPAAAGDDIAKRISSAMRSLIGAKCGIEGVALSPDETRNALVAKSYSTAVADDVRALLAALDDCSYRPGGATADEVRELCPRALEVVNAIEGRSRAAHGVKAGAIVLAVLFTTSISADEQSRAFAWDMANATMSRANTAEDFESAAELYVGMVDDGARNGPLFANLGVALLMAGDGRDAETAFARAERYAGASPELESGIRAARAMAAGSQDSQPHWSRIVFFWHFALATPTRVQIAAAGWCLLWLGVMIRIIAGAAHRKGGSLAATLMVAGAIATLVFGTSATLTIMQERADKGFQLTSTEVQDGR